MIKINKEIVEKIIKRIENELKYNSGKVNKCGLIELEMDLNSFFFVNNAREVIGYLPFIVNEIESVIFNGDKIIFFIAKD